MTTTAPTTPPARPRPAGGMVTMGRHDVCRRPLAALLPGDVILLSSADPASIAGITAVATRVDARRFLEVYVRCPDGAYASLPQPLLHERDVEVVVVRALRGGTRPCEACQAPTVYDYDLVQDMEVTAVVCQPCFRGGMAGLPRG